MTTRLATIDHDDPAVLRPKEVFSTEELDAALDLLTAHSPSDAPWMAHVTRANGDTLSVGLGAPLIVDSRGDELPTETRPGITVLSWVQADSNPPYYTSKSATPAAHNFVFFTDGSWSEFLAETAILPEVARHVLREFVTSSQRPTSIEWKEV